MTPSDHNADEYASALASHLAPENTRRLLTLSGLYLTAFELVTTNVVASVEDFFTRGWDANKGWLMSDEWTTEVMVGHKHKFDGCVAWLVRSKVLSDAQASSARRLRDARNRVAHGIATIVADPAFEFDLQVLFDAQVVLKRVAVFFGGAVAETDPTFDDRPVDYEGIESGASSLYSHVLGAFLSELGSQGTAA